MIQRRTFLHFALASGALSLLPASLTACGKKTVKARLVPAGSTVLALGDSLTAGYGASEETSYPTVLAKLTGWNVVNAGISGDQTADALQRLPALLAAHQPALVLTGIGGNDFLRQVAESKTRANISKICEQTQHQGAQQILIAIPKISVFAATTGILRDHPLYAELAQKFQLPLFEAGWASILSNPDLRSDEIHANAEGYARFAQILADFLRKVGCLS